MDIFEYESSERVYDISLLQSVSVQVCIPTAS